MNCEDILGYRQVQPLVSDMEENQKQLSRLCKAINDNKPWIVISTLKRHSELITRVLSTSGETALMMTIKRGCSSEYIAKIIEMTPEGGRSLSDNDGNTALHMVAMAGNNIEVADQLLEKCPDLLRMRNNSEDMPIHVAVKQGHRDMKDHLLKMAKQQGYDDPFAGVNSEDILRSAIRDGMNDVIIALSYNDPELVLRPVVEEERIEEQAKSELLEAIQNDNWMRIRSTLEAHPELSTESVTTSGETPIMMAVKRGCSFNLIKTMIEEIMSAEALAMKDNSGNTVLHTVAMLGNTELAKLLLTKRPDLLRVRNNLGEVPIFVAINQGDRNMTEILFKAGAGAGAETNGDPFAGADCSVNVIYSAVRAEIYDVASFICEKHPQLEASFMRASAEDPSACRFHNYMKGKRELYAAINTGNWKGVDALLEKQPELSTSIVTSFGSTPIMRAADRRCSINLMRTMIGRMSDEALATTNYSRNSVLHIAAELGSAELAKLLFTRSPDLLCLRNNWGDVPIFYAIAKGQKEMTDILFKEGQEKYGDPFGGAAVSVGILCSAIRAGMYDVASFINNRHPELAMKDSSVLGALAEDPSAFRFRNYNQRALATTLKSIFCMDSSPNDYVTTMLTKICQNTLNSHDDRGSSLLHTPLLLAARNGIETIVSTILYYHPDAIYFVDNEKNSIFHLAVMYRHENIFKFACQKGFEQSRYLLSWCNTDGNNVLHLAGYAPREKRLVQSTGVILQMQHELKWFRELENLLPPRDIKLVNKLGKAPLTIFNEEHKDMVAKEIQWMTSMASACSVAAPLIATVAFAAAITVPGGNNSSGFPMFSNHKSFQVFVVSDALALFSSIACVLSFLSIFTSRYGVDDFLYALPNRLIIGLISLFIAAISLMIAFGATLFLVFGQENSVILILIIVFSCAPVLLYAILQLPSLLNMIKTTYGRKLFRKRASIKHVWHVLSGLVR